ncbi:hypothetical protein A0H76_1513 [Hepatospora eriocheir]|uniref:Uncharacterized protein n=1 Tax=Hepatospora eriocheir TaxID=1081669 RepID=A0A1X0QH03_9MICR|nr:hypothetical protein A0H76_1513 [Hepatospora eriocheir]
MKKLYHLLKKTSFSQTYFGILNHSSITNFSNSLLFFCLFKCTFLFKIVQKCSIGLISDD